MSEANGMNKHKRQSEANIVVITYKHKDSRNENLLLKHILKKQLSLGGRIHNNSMNNIKIQQEKKEQMLNRSKPKADPR